VGRDAWAHCPLAPIRLVPRPLGLYALLTAGHAVGHGLDRDRPAHVLVHRQPWHRLLAISQPLDEREIVRRDGTSNKRTRPDDLRIPLRRGTQRVPATQEEAMVLLLPPLLGHKAPKRPEREAEDGFHQLEVGLVPHLVRYQAQIVRSAQLLVPHHVPQRGPERLAQQRIRDALHMGAYIGE
jgi:hypothetical protein